VFYDDIWGPEIGFYGGVNYGFGFTGVGYEGGHSAVAKVGVVAPADATR
jgi:hypothetical protein